MTRSKPTNTPPLPAAPSDAVRVSLIIGLVALATGVSADQIRSPSRNAQVSRARQLAMYLTYVVWQWPLYRIGAAFGRDRTTAGHACRVIEDLRDNRTFDEKLERLETCLEDMPETLDLMARGIKGLLKAV